MNIRRLLGLGCAIAAIAVGTPAAAAEYAFNYTATEGDNVTPLLGSGTLTTSDTPNSDGSYLVTGLTGSIGDRTINSLLAPGTFFDNENLVYPVRSSTLDYYGISFELNSVPFNLFRDVDGIDKLIYDNSSPPAYGLFTISAVSAAVPEPATWAMMLLGFGVVGCAVRSQRRSAPLMHAA